MKKQLICFLIPWLFSPLLTGAAEPLLTISFDQAKTNWQGSGGEAGGSGKVRLVPRLGRNHSTALCWEYDLGATPGACIYSRCQADVQLPGRPVLMKFHLYGNGGNLIFGFRIKDSTGRIWQFSLPAIDWNGWREITVELEPAKVYSWGGKGRADGGFEYPISLLEFMIDNKPDHLTKKKKGAILMDDFRFFERDVEEF